MKHRLIITISDIKGTKSYSVSKFFRKFIFWIIGFIVLTAVIGTIVIPILTNKVMELTLQNEIYQQDLDDKIAAYEKLDDKFSTLEIRIEEYEKMSAPPAVFQKQDGLASKAAASPEERLAKLKSDYEFKKFILKHIPNGSPVRNSVITSSFGYRYHPVFKARKMHFGVDFKASMNTPIHSAADGVVIRVVSRDVGGYGKLVVIRHKYRFDTAFAHLDQVKVDVGDIVKKGQIIGMSGNSGRSTGPHLHYEVHYNGNAINPSSFISWSMVNYNKIFSNQKDVTWQSLIKRIRS